MTDQPEAAAKPVEAPLKLVPASKALHIAKPKPAKKKLADAHEGQVPRPPSALGGGANNAKPR